MSLPDTQPSLAQSPALPLSAEGEPVFPEPWAAEAFAMTVLLYEKGLFTWADWANTLSAALRKQNPSKGGDDYFDCWAMALTSMLTERGVVDTETVLALQKSWQRAAEATPHGAPIELANDPLR